MLLILATVVKVLNGSGIFSLPKRPPPSFCRVAVNRSNFFGRKDRGRTF